MNRAAIKDQNNVLRTKNDSLRDGIARANKSIERLRNLSPAAEERAREEMKKRVRDVDNRALDRIYLRQLPDIANSTLHSITQMKARQDVDAWGREGDKYLSRQFSKRWWSKEIGRDKLKIEKRVRVTFVNDMRSYLHDVEQDD